MVDAPRVGGRKTAQGCVVDVVVTVPVDEAYTVRSQDGSVDLEQALLAVGTSGLLARFTL